MSEGLEALEVSKQLKDFVLEFVKNGLDRRFIHGSFDIIDTALKRLNELDIDLIHKLQALHIIKKLPKEEKQVLLNMVYTHTKSEEEYDLLKEVLL